jgi:hypothetical protein
MYGPGTYFSQNAKAASKTEIYGSYPHRHSLTPSSITKTLKSKGFINPKQMGAKIEEFFGPNVGNAEEAYSDVLTLMPVNHPFIQGLIKEGYLGYKYGNSFTNWALGSDKSFAKSCLCFAVQAHAPERQASARGTMWSMSRLASFVYDFPS